MNLRNDVLIKNKMGNILSSYSSNLQSFPINIDWDKSTIISDNRCKLCGLHNFNFEKNNLTNYPGEIREIKTVIHKFINYDLCKKCDEQVISYINKNNQNNIDEYLFHFDLCGNCGVLSTISYFMSNDLNQTHTDLGFKIVKKQFCINCIEDKCLMCNKLGYFNNKIDDFQKYNNKFTFCDDCWEFKDIILILKNESSVIVNNIYNILLNKNPLITTKQYLFHQLEIIMLHIRLCNLHYSTNISKFLTNQKYHILRELLNDDTSYISMLNKNIILEIINKYRKILIN